MKKTILILLIFLIGFISMGQTTVYIDPTYSGTPRLGTIDRPYNGWSDFGFDFQSNTTYLMKAGTTYTKVGYSGYEINGDDNVTIGRYGDGANPRILIPYVNPTSFRIYSTGGNRVDNIKIEHITFINEPLLPSDGTIGISVESHSGGRIGTIRINDCEVVRGSFGMRFYAYDPAGTNTMDSIIITNCRLYNQGNDGIVALSPYSLTGVGYLKYIEVGNCTVTGSNQFWFEDPNMSYSSGDNLQVACYRSAYIHDNVFSRQETSNKFCVILSYGDIAGSKCVIEDNVFYPPKDTINPSGNGTAGAALAVYSYVDKVIANRNYFSCRGVQAYGGGVARGFYLQADTIVANYNVCDSTGENMFWGTNRIDAYNNTFISHITAFPTGHFYSIMIPNNSTGNWKNNIVLYSNTVTGFNTGINYLSQSNNLHSGSNPSTWNTLGFVNVSGGNYSLTSNATSLINKASSTYPGMVIDIQGNVVPSNTLYDIGAYELMNVNPIVSNFVANNTNPTTQQTVIFTDQSTNGPTSWIWSFSPNTVTYMNGTTATSQHPQVRFNAAGSYTVTLVATNNISSDTEVKNNYITTIVAMQPPVASFSINIPVNTKYTFNDFSTNNPTKWEWIFKGGYPEKSTEKNPTVYWKNPGRYDVVLTVGNSGGSSTYKMPGYVNVVKTPVPISEPPTSINENLRQK